MSPVTVSSVVARPAAEVFAYVTDPTLFPQRQQGVIDGHLEGQGAGASGGSGPRRRSRARRQARKEMPANMAALKERVEASDQPPPV